MCVAFIAVALPVSLGAQQFARPDLRATAAPSAPVIDGILNDETWQVAPLETGEWLSYNPLNGDRVPQLTTVWLTYDDDYLYIAFKCEDPEPSGIKTSVTRRDNIWQDDWVGVSLDTLGTGQTSYHMMVNPSGVQLDLLNSAAGGEDSAPDWIWDSAGRLTDTGYAVEVRLPLQSVRFKGGRDLRMGLLFFRRISRLGVSVSWPAMPSGMWVFDRHASLFFDQLQPRPVRELLPSATFARDETRASPTAWERAISNTEVGLSGKVGLTSTITLDATVNPDFSQVESDAFQVEVNQRFPVFFAEKRPFFMEGTGIFRACGRRRRRQSADGGAHPPHCRSERWRQAHRQRGPRQFCRAVRTRRGGRSRSAVQHRPRAVQPWPQQLRGRALYRYVVERRRQSRDWRRPHVAPLAHATDRGLCAAVGHTHGQG